MTGITRLEKNMALKGIRVLELSGLAPGPMCGMILSDFGARVIRVDRADASGSVDRLCRGKESIALDLKKPAGKAIFLKLCKRSDVLIEPYRAGVMERMGLGPEILMKENEKLVYARLTGYGQTGPMAKRAGHDINYLALSGVLSRLGRHKEKPHAPINLMADFAGGGVICALGICMALLERSNSGKGQVIDSSMVEGAAYVASWLWSSRNLHIWQNERGKNTLDGGAAFYDVYKTKDDKYMAVGAIEPQFYQHLISGLNLSEEEAPQFCDTGETKRLFEKIFSTKTQLEWTKIFEHSDGCVTPVLTFDDVAKNEHNVARTVFVKAHHEEIDIVPAPAPKLSRTPATIKNMQEPMIGQHTMKVLEEAGLNESDIKHLEKNGIVKIMSSL